MYLAELEIENFRLFGSREAGTGLKLELDPGLNLIVGENDSGKSALMDAIRLLIGTASNEWFRITSSDFNFSAGQQATELKITGVFRGLGPEELAGLVNFITLKTVDGEVRHELRLRLEASRRDSSANRGREVVTSLKAGDDAHSIPFEGYAREFVKAIYLKPLRDAVQELAARQGSRLSQILYAHPELRKHERSDWSAENPDTIPMTLLGIVQQADYRIKSSEVVEQTQDTLNDLYLNEFSLGDKPLRGAIGLRSAALRQLLERMELYLEHDEALISGANRGLGINDLLFMATELLLLGAMEEPYLPLILIEEPEAHLHPQLQLLLVEYLQAKSKKSADSPVEEVQVILTCHSPNLASKVDLQQLIVMRNGHAFRMGAEHTLLDQSDYGFLRRFLDVTRASLFFARGLLIVEGDAEQLLLPAIANLLGIPLTKSGVSIVNVGHVGLFRYMRIFQRRAGPSIPVFVSCLVDRDIPPAEAQRYLRNPQPPLEEADIHARTARKMRYDGQLVHTFVSPSWTLEYDLALNGLAHYLASAIELAKITEREGESQSAETAERVLTEQTVACTDTLQAGTTQSQLAADIYEDLYLGRVSKAETAQYFALLLELRPPAEARNLVPAYIVRALEYATGRAEVLIEGGFVNADA